MKVATILMCLLLLSGCTGKLAPSKNDAVLDPDKNDDKICGLDSCHGYEDITCGSNVPDFCTMEYRIGDFCRQFAVCEVIGGECQIVPNEKLDQCRDCVRQCENDGMTDVFECENACREELE
jgi:hypothetical protein